MKKLFPQKPEDLGAASTDELNGLLSEIATVAKAIQAGDADLSELGASDEERATEVVSQMREAKALREEIKGVLDERASAQENFTSDVADLAAALSDEAEPVVEPEPAAEPPAALAAASEPEPSEPAPEPEPEPSEPEPSEPAAALAAVEEPVAEPEPEPVAAAPRRYAIPATPSQFTPPEIDGIVATAIRAVGGLETMTGRHLKDGSPLDRNSLAEAAIMLAKRMGPVRKRQGGGEERFNLASAHFVYDDDVTLIAGDYDGNARKIRQWGNPFLGQDGIDALVAAGGICAPPTPFYDPPGFASRARPVRDSLPTFNAPRGGVSIPSVAIVDRSDAGVTVIEEDEDAEGGTFAVKACRTMDCATWTDTFVGIISHCLEIGNLNAITWPEGVALENDNLMSGWAATADTRLLDRIKALSVKTTSTAVYNAVHGLIYDLVRVKASIRSVLRADDGIGYTALMPEWVPELLVADLAAQSGTVDRYVARDAVANYLTRHGIRIFWYKDSPTTDETQLFSAEVDGSSIDNFPSVIQSGLWINGALIRLDTGDLELGLVRDSALNEINQYQLFGESFENVARVGPTQGVRWMRSTICPDGTFPALQTALSC